VWVILISDFGFRIFGPETSSFDIRRSELEIGILVSEPKPSKFLKTSKVYVLISAAVAAIFIRESGIFRLAYVFIKLDHNCYSHDSLYLVHCTLYFKNGLEKRN
jgi:hypothetical protein